MVLRVPVTSSSSRTLVKINLVKANAVRTGSIIRLKIKGSSSLEVVINRSVKTLKATTQGPPRLSSSKRIRRTPGKTSQPTPTSSVSTPARRTPQSSIMLSNPSNKLKHL